MGSVCPSCYSSPVSDELDILPDSSQPAYQYLLQVTEAEARFISLLFPPDSTLNLVVNKEPLKVYTKDTDLGFMIRSEWISVHPAKEIIAFLSNLEERMKWDKNQETLEEVGKLDDITGIYYKTYKKMLGMSRRDVVYVSRWREYEGGWIDVSTSVLHPDFPEKQDSVRMQIYLGGYYAKSLSPGQTQVICISECSFGGSIPKTVIKAASVATIPAFARDLDTALTQYKQSS